MTTTIVFKSVINEQSGPPREVLCSVWPVSKDGDELVIGNPIFSNHMVLVGAQVSEMFGSILKLPNAGVYLVDVGYPSGQSLRTTITVAENQNYILAMETLKQVPVMPDKAKNASSLEPRVVSSTPRRNSTKKIEIKVSLISQPNPISLPGLYESTITLGRSNKHKENIFTHRVSTELVLELPLIAQPQRMLNEFESVTERKWLMVSSKGKPQTLLAYPDGWICENSTPFKLMMGRKNNEGKDANKWSVSLKLMDPVYGSLVEYLTRRDLFSIRSISENERGKAATALYKKVGNPFTAAAAAYVFALTGSEESRYHSWMEILSSRYSWLPDGAIALGWKILREAKNDAIAWDNARKLFLLACSRGLPYYTVGLHILVDALTLLRQVNPDDSEILEMLAVAKAADVACVRTEPFTTLQISRYLGLPMKRE